jgi:chromosome segregation ATPase
MDLVEEAQALEIQARETQRVELEQRCRTAEEALAAKSQELIVVHERLASMGEALTRQTAISEEANNRRRRFEERVALLEQDLRYIGDALLEEAQSRDWCSEYDTFADNVNDHTSTGQWLAKCARHYTVQLTVSVSGTVRNLDDFQTAVIAAYESTEVDLDEGDIDEVTVSLR